VSPTGEGGLLAQLTKLVLESVVGGRDGRSSWFGKRDPAGRAGGNSRNGRRSTTVVTEVGPVEIDDPRDREGNFTPQIVRKRHGGSMVWTASSCRLYRKPYVSGPSIKPITLEGGNRSFRDDGHYRSIDLCTRLVSLTTDTMANRHGS
jgi:hypothetical protein